MYVIGEACIDLLDRSCLEACPVDCIYEGGRKLYIHPEECIDCGACEPMCPVEAIAWERDLDDAEHAADAVRFFYEPLPGREAIIGAPGGARDLGVVGQDTELVAAAAPSSAVPHDRC